MLKISIKLAFLFLFINLNMSFCQNTDHYDSQIDSLIEYKIKNIGLSLAIDSSIQDLGKINYYKLHPFLIWISIYDSNKVEISMIPYAMTMIHKRRMNQGIFAEGICFYKNYNIIITSYIKDGIKNYFHSTKKYRNLRFKNSENLLDHSNGYLFTTINTIYKKHFILDKGDSYSRKYYTTECLYLIAKGDTWNEIANKLKCNVEDLKKGYPEMETPLDGYLLYIIYSFDKNGNFEGIVRN